jgi:CubicO group peptidase (beta-lactamase class C family)
VSGQRFAAYVNDHVLKPIGMTRSFVMDGKRTADPNVARGYTLSDDKLEPADNYPLFGGSGGLMTTINDLAKWDYDIGVGHKVWTPEVRKLMVEPGLFNNGVKVTRSGRGTYYASGLSVGPNWFGHGGGARGFKTYYAHDTARRLGVALLCNRGEVDPIERADKVVAAIGGGLPAISEPSVQSAAINGRYRSENLDAFYVLELGADDMLNVTVVGADGATRRTITGLKRTPMGGYKGENLEIVPDDDQRGFMLETGRVNLPFVRAS